MSSIIFVDATESAKDLGSCGCGGVGPFIGTKRLPALKDNFNFKHSAANVDELELGIRKDTLSTTVSLYMSAEGATTVLHVTGRCHVPTHRCGEASYTTCWS